MSEQDVRAKLERQRGNRQREDMESATPTATGGSTGLPGGQGSADPNQLLVLLGDAGGENIGRKEWYPGAEVFLMPAVSCCGNRQQYRSVALAC